MALHQQLARVSTEYLDACRRAAAASADGDPGWGPPSEDEIDLDWAAWGLGNYLRWAEGDPELIRTLERSLDGDDPSAVRYLDHLEFYDRMGEPPALLVPSAVAELSARLDAVDTAALFARFPEDRELAASVTKLGLGGTYTLEWIARHFAMLREFYRGAAARGLAVVVWVD
ncbi:DUF1877 family protein [Kitasatospora albolonga]|uniref:DUF1877 family protein n=1 Tax=Kitasatospora albolonga TaxID=68173 RepID=UPI0031F02C2E